LRWRGRPEELAILILDEPDAARDPRRRAAVLRSLERLRQGARCFVVAPSVTRPCGRRTCYSSCRTVKLLNAAARRVGGARWTLRAVCELQCGAPRNEEGHCHQRWGAGYLEGGGMQVAQTCITSRVTGTGYEAFWLDVLSIKERRPTLRAMKWSTISRAVRTVRAREHWAILYDIAKF